MKRPAEIKKLIREGCTMEWIAGHFNVSRQRILQILQSNGYRPHGRASRASEVKYLHAKGYSDDRIAKKMGISVGSVIWHRNNLKLRRICVRNCEVCEGRFEPSGRATMCPECAKKYGANWTQLKWQIRRYPALIRAAIRISKMTRRKSERL